MTDEQVAKLGEVLVAQLNVLTEIKDLLSAGGNGPTISDAAFHSEKVHGMLEERFETHRRV
jgi:hypothetical protein